MAEKRGFSLVEMIVALVIVGIAAVCVLPNLIVSSEVTKAQAVQNNLLAIAAAQQKYFEDSNNTSYCLAGCGDTKANINSNLRLSISTNDPFTYVCSATGGNIPYQCIAQDNTDTLTLNPNAVPIVTCVGPAGNQSYCPS